MWLRQSTASQEISLGQFLDSTDGDTEENGLTIANTDIKLRKGGTTTLANKNSGGATSISNGVYHATLDATDTNTLGLLEVYVHVSGALATKSTYMVLPATAYDALVTDGLFNFDPATDAVANVTLCATTTTNTDMRGTDSAALATALATVDTNVDAILVDTGTTIPAQITGLNDIAATDIVSGGAITTSAGAVSNVTTVATTTTNTDMRGTDSANTVAPDNASIAAILTDTGTTLPAQITALNDITVSDILTTQMTESYAADGVAPTLAQALFLVQQTIGDFSIAGTTITTKKLDGTTTAATYTLDDGTNPTSRTRAT